MKRERRKFSEEYKREAVRLALAGSNISQTAKDLDLTESALGRWIKEYKAGGGESGLTPSEKEELKQLRKENANLRLERDILKKATALFAKESK